MKRFLIRYTNPAAKMALGFIAYLFFLTMVVPYLVPYIARLV